MQIDSACGVLHAATAEVVDRFVGALHFGIDAIYVSGQRIDAEALDFGCLGCRYFQIAFARLGFDLGAVAIAPVEAETGLFIDVIIGEAIELGFACLARYGLSLAWSGKEQGGGAILGWSELGAAERRGCEGAG